MQLKSRATNFDNLVRIRDKELLLLRASLRVEMRKRGITDWVVEERLTIEQCRKFPGLPKLQPIPYGTKNVDAFSLNSERFPILTAFEGSKRGTVCPEPNDHDKQFFEHVLIVKLAEDWPLQSIHQLAWAKFVKVRSWNTNAWCVAISGRTVGAATLIFKAPRPPDA